MAKQTETDNSAVIQDFKDVVNMSAKELETWLKTEESESVGIKEKEGGESTGHESGRQIIEILHKKKTEYTEDDFKQMRRVISYVRRHSAQKPSGDIEHSRWRYSLKNWGHDPVKKS
jgi:DNA topoisomerase VI subunit B